MNPRRVVVLTGPTASGKTALGLALAQRVGGEIISADARQVYRGLDVGTAKPTAAERARVPHHGLDLVGPDEPFDVARWAAEARRTIDRLHGRGTATIVVGGTGLYVRILTRGLCEAPGRVPALRVALEGLMRERGQEEGRRWLRRLDPVAAAQIHPHDRVRLVRALEVALHSGRRLSDHQRAHRFATPRYDVHVVTLVVPTTELDARIRRRTRAMLRSGWVEEVRRLVGTVPGDAPAWRTLGYRELRSHVQDGRPLAEVEQAIVVATRRFAKRQRTWLRRESRLQPMVWRDPDREREQLLAEAARFLVAKRPGAS